MHFPETYRIIPREKVWNEGSYSIIPIRYKDRLDIMKWRNEQIYHLRQNSKLTKSKQDEYYKNIIEKLFYEIEPSQILFSYMKEDVCIGYGGLVNINWDDANAEISFIMETQLEKKSFISNWSKFLTLIQRIAFNELGLYKIYTYAYDIRPKLYDALESIGFIKEATLSNHFQKELGTYLDVLIQSKYNDISFRLVEDGDKKLIFHWANDKITRDNSFNSEPINFEEHSNWFDQKQGDRDVEFYIFSFKGSNFGTVIFDKNKIHKTAIIGINIAPEFRRRGLAKKILRISCCHYLRKHPQLTIKAYVKTDNISSIKIFTSSAFKCVGNEYFNQIPAKVFKLKI